MIGLIFGETSFPLEILKKIKKIKKKYLIIDLTSSRKFKKNNKSFAVSMGQFGRIINIISTSVNQVIPGLGVSNTVRGAVSQWAKTLALELGDSNITVNNILPGYTKTNRLKELAENKATQNSYSVSDIMEEWASSTALKRLAEPIEIANAVLFLASKEASYITGHNLSVDGGRYKS